METKKCLKIVFSVVLSDAGEVTRAIEIADGIRIHSLEGYELETVCIC